MASPDLHTGTSPPPYEDSPITVNDSHSSGTPNVTVKKAAVTPEQAGHAMPFMNVNKDGSAEVIDSSSTDTGPLRSRAVTRVAQRKRDRPTLKRKSRRESSESK